MIYVKFSQPVLILSLYFLFISLPVLVVNLLISYGLWIFTDMQNNCTLAKLTQLITCSETDEIRE